MEIIIFGSPLDLGSKDVLAKSVLLGIKLGEDEIQELANTIGCSVGSWPIKYLGLLLGGNLLKKEFWAPVIDKINKCLEGWKKACIST